jgi:hypothetical protein
MPFVIRWITRTIGAAVVARVVKYAQSPQGRARMRREADRLRRTRR